jgi:hypothetical protein
VTRSPVLWQGQRQVAIHFAVINGLLAGSTATAHPLAGAEPKACCAPLACIGSVPAVAPAFEGQVFDGLDVAEHLIMDQLEYVNGCGAEALYLMAPAERLRQLFDRLTSIGGRFFRDHVPGTELTVRLNPATSLDQIRAKAAANVLVDRIRGNR